MKTKSLPILLTVFISLLSACGQAPAQTVETTRLVPQTVEITRLVPQTVEVTRGVSPTAVLTHNITETPSPNKTPENSLNQRENVNNFEISSLLQIFPLYKGTSWSYTGINYSQAGSDPETVLKAVTYIDERVIDTQIQPPYYFAHIQRSTTLVKVDPGWWQYNTSPQLGNEDFWYIVLNGHVYLSYDRPDPAKIKSDQLSEEFDFPMTVGLSWCPNKIQKGYLTPVAETPVPCASAGAREILGEESYKTQAGNFDHCYQLSDFYNSGGPIQWFCNGVGIVAEEYDHSGSLFGASKGLIKFTRGSIP